MRVTMSARATKKAEADTFCIGRHPPKRAAAGGDGCLKDIFGSSHRTGVVAAAPRGSGLGSGHRAVLRGEPDTCARSHSEIIRRRFARDISAVRHLRLADPDRGAA